jgi:hypothetical protein
MFTLEQILRIAKSVGYESPYHMTNTTNPIDFPRVVETAVVALIPEYHQVKVQDDDGHQYVLTRKTEGIDLAALHEGQRIVCTVTQKLVLAADTTERTVPQLTDKQIALHEGIGKCEVFGLNALGSIIQKPEAIPPPTLDGDQNGKIQSSRTSSPSKTDQS